MAAGIMADYLCECGFQFEHFFSNPPDSLPCEAEDCDKQAVRIYSLPGQFRPRDAQSFRPVMVDQAPDGSYSIPGHAGAPVPEGFIRKELRTVAEVRAFERNINAQERRQWEAQQAREHEAYSEGERMRRRDFFQRMQDMSPAGRELARLAIEHNNNRPRRKYTRETFVEVFSRDSSNREAGVSELTDWRPVRR